MFKNAFDVRLLEPENDLNGGGAAPGPDAGTDAGTDAGESRGPTMEETARNTYRALMQAAGEEAEDEGDPEPRYKSQPRVNGKFAKAEQDGEQQDQPPTDEVDQQTQQPQPQPHDAFPNTWRKELQQKWASLDPEVRAEIHKREQDFHNGVRQYKEAAGFGAQMAQAMQPYQHIMQERGVHPVALVRDIMGALHELATGSEESKAQRFLQLANDYGINLDAVQLLRQRAPAGAAPDLSPVLQRVQQLEARISQADQEREQRQREEDEARVTAFLNDPKNEHAKTVAKQMAALLQSGEAQDLKDAYEKAIWLHPETRAKLLQKQEAERRKREAEEAAAARKAAAATVQRRGTPPAPGKRETMEDTARSVYRRLVPGG